MLKSIGLQLGFRTDPVYAYAKILILKQITTKLQLKNTEI